MKTEFWNVSAKTYRKVLGRIKYGQAMRGKYLGYDHDNRLVLVRRNSKIGSIVLYVRSDYL